MSTVTVETIGEVSTVTVDTQEFNIISEGIQGPPGPPGGAIIAGYFTEAADIVQNGDLLTFSGTKWINTRRTEVSDGGNF